MPDPTDSRGRRANGLPATDWGALVDLDPRLSGGLLDRLAAAGVAAYVEPATAVDTVHRAVTMPPRPMDRLWVDPSRADSAREVVASEVADLTALLAEDDPGATAHGLVHPVPRYAARRVLAPPALPGPPGPAAAQVPAAVPAAPLDAPAQPAGPPSDDDVFADLVARFHSPAPATPGGWPAAEDLPGPPAPHLPGAPPHRRRTDGPVAPGPSASVDQPPVDTPPTDWLPAEALADDGHFVPPPPPPVPRLRLRTLAAVLAVLLGLAALFAPQLLRLSATSEVSVAGLLLLAGGATALVWSMRDTDSGPDDGAVV